ncbi:MAG: hydroxyacid dehydrogenase [Streptosporangiaceae bacterium]
MTLRVGVTMDESALTPASHTRLRAVADVSPGFGVDTEVLLTGWGSPRVDAAALASMPRLRAVVHSAGSVRPVVGPEVFARGIVVSSAADSNAIPVAEFTLAAVIFAAKRVTRMADGYRRADRFSAGFIGTNGITVGVVGASRIGRRVIGLLRSVLDVRVLVSDPYATSVDGASLVGLDELVRASDIVTLHAPALPSTRHLINAARLAAMRDGAVLINTARGSLVDTAALTAELVAGRLDAVLDVTDPEPLPDDSPLLRLPNVLLTPHIAGAMGNEVARLGDAAVAEIERLAAGQPLAHPVVLEDLERIA